GATGLAVTSNNGIVYLTGTVPSADRLTRATQLARGVSGVRSVVNNMMVASAPPVIAIVPPGVVPPPTGVAPGQPPIDASGVVAQFDPQTNTITFQDGRMVRLGSGATVWGPANVSALQPGASVLVRNQQHMRYRPGSS